MRSKLNKGEKEDMKKYDILVIGGGPAAITIAKILGGKKEVAVIRPEDHSMIYCAMPYVIEDILPLEKTFKKDELVTDSGASLIKDGVDQVDLENKTVHTAKGDIYGYEKLIIATGAIPVIPAVEGHDLEGVMSFKTEYDLRRMLESSRNGLRRAVVVGAGAIGIELAQAFNKVGVETHIIDMEEHILPNLMDYEMVEEAQERLIASGLNIHLRNRVTGLRGDERVREVIMGRGDSISLHPIDDCSSAEVTNSPQCLVVFAVGMRPNVSVFLDTDLLLGPDGIIINGKMETNVTDVYAVGDCAQFTSALTGEILSGKLATNAVPMAKVLAGNLLGRDAEYVGFINGSATKIGDLFVGGTGFTERAGKDRFDMVAGYSDLTTAFPIMPDAKKVRMKLLADRKSGRIVGGQVAAGTPVTDKVDLITMAVQYGITAQDLTGFSYSSQPYQSFFPANNLITAAAEDIIKKMQ
jgi:NADH dehydrogenase/NADH oxidase (H2O2-forming)